MPQYSIIRSSVDGVQLQSQLFCGDFNHNRMTEENILFEPKCHDCGDTNLQSFSHTVNSKKIVLV